MAKLQEICQNIGSDLPSEPKKRKSSSLDQKSDRQSYKLPSSKSPQAKMAKTEHRRPSPQVKSPAELTSSHLPANRQQMEQTDLDKQLAAQYQLMYQGIWYQAELERLKASQLQTYQHLLTKPQPAADSSLNFGSGLDFTRLANLFLNRGYQAPSDIRSVQQRLITERLQLPASNTLLAAQEPQLHRCNWVTATGFCGKTFYSNEDLMLHLQLHVCSTSETAMSTCSTSTCLPKLCRTQISSDITRMTSPQRYHPYGLSLNSHPTAAQLFH